MSDKIEYNKKMIGQKVKVVENNSTWFGEIKDIVEDHSFLVKDHTNRDTVVSIYDIRSVDVSQLAQT
tara:strand:- start:1799 stop:1999 length:201 start_codon:yes stop_codon:yes gene_type:complete